MLHKILMTFVFLGLSTLAQAQNSRLKDDLNDLDSPEKAQSLSQSQMYSVRLRDVPLEKRWAVFAGGGMALQGNSFLESREINLDVNYFLNSKWWFGAGYTHVTNKFTAAADSLQKVSGYLPKVDYAKSRLEAHAFYNLFYGKFRVTQRQSFVFDQYLGLGVAQNELVSGTATGVSGDVGLILWPMQHASFRLGVRDHFYKESGADNSSHHVNLYAQAGFLF